MENKKQELLDFALSELKCKNLKGFIFNIQALHEISTCNCFFKNNIKTFSEMLQIIESIEDSETDFFINISKGFIYLLMKNFSKAFNYLNIAITLYSFNDLAFSLIAKVGKEFNPIYLEHAKYAVLLNPIARNYFILASLYNYKSENEIDYLSTIFFYKKAIELNPHFACAHSNLGNVYENHKEYISAIEEYRICLNLEPNHWAYRMLFDCLFMQKQYEEALKTAIKGFEIHPDEKEYFYKLGYSYFSMGNYKLSIDNFKEYINIYPDRQSVKNILKIVELKLKEKIDNSQCQKTIFSIEKVSKAQKVINKTEREYNYDSHDYAPRELESFLYDAFEGQQDAYDEWSQR